MGLLILLLARRIVVAACPAPFRHRVIDSSARIVDAVRAGIFRRAWIDDFLEFRGSFAISVFSWESPLSNSKALREGLNHSTAPRVAKEFPDFWHQEWGQETRRATASP